MVPMVYERSVVEYVRVMRRLFKLKLTSEEYEGYLNATQCVWGADFTPLDIMALHRILFPQCDDAGKYRQHAIFDTRNYRVKNLPASCVVSDFMRQKFAPVYAQALSLDMPKVPDVNYDPEMFAWCIGASFRCIRPFKRGNRQLSHLIENHVLHAYRRKWRTRPRPKFVFDHFRETGFREVFGHIYIDA
jgi:hypothetical protein